MRILPIILGLLLLAGIIVAADATFVVDETKQAVITQFGEPIGTPVTEAGLHFKLPIVQNVNYFDKRILSWDGDPNQIPTLDKRFIWVDTTARWKIVDALKFMKSVGTEAAARARLDDIIDASTRDAISGKNLVEVVRNSNRLVNTPVPMESVEAVIEMGDLEKITFGQQKLMEEVIKNASEIVPEFGIQIVDVKIKRINYVEEVRKKVYERMISERNRAAEHYRSEGQGKKAEIEGQMTKELQEIRSRAYRQAQELKGNADAKAIEIYAEAYNKDPEFYAFMKSLETYKKTLNADTTLILSTDSEFFEYLKSSQSKIQP